MLLACVVVLSKMPIIPLKRSKQFYTDGYIFDSSDPRMGVRLKQERPELWQGLVEIRNRLLNNAELCERIRHKYRQKNTTGYALNALLDFEQPEDILAHLLIGSEGTLAFIAEAELHTVPDPQTKWTGLVFFETITEACQAVPLLQATEAAAIELMDYASLRAFAPRPFKPVDRDFASELRLFVGPNIMRKMRLH